MILVDHSKRLMAWPYCERIDGNYPFNYPVFTVVLVIYHYVERIWRILVTPIFVYNISDH